MLCALSGGVDSSVLLDALLKCREKLGIEVKAAHFNHMLRGAEADADARFVMEKCRDCGIELICESGDVAAFAEREGMSDELAARILRYEFLERAKKACNATKIATAHNANDNLETLIFNLARGGGADGLCGIPPVRGDIIRPLIGITRDEIEEYAEKNGIAFCVDATNFETIYTRNKIRHTVIPAILEINPAAVENAFRSSEIIREEAALLGKLARDEFLRLSDSGTECERKALLSVPNALFGRVCELFVRQALGDDAFTLEYRHVCDIHTLAESDSPSKAIDLPGNVIVRCEYEKLVFAKRAERSLLSPVILGEGEFTYGGYTITVVKTENNGKIHNSVNTFLIPCDRIYGNMVVRKRAEGDMIKFVRRPQKKIKKFFIDERVPKTERDSVPIIADDKNVLAVCGFGQDERFLPECGEAVFLIKMRCGKNEE